jgi:hypothetical protein
VYPVLYARRLIYVNRDEDMSIPGVGKKLPPTLVYTKELEIILQSESYDTALSLKGFAPFLRRVLRVIPNLQTFRYELHYFDVTFDLSNASLTQINHC